MNSITIQIPDYLRKQVENLAAEEGFTVDQFFATAASEKLVWPFSNSPLPET